MPLSKKGPPPASSSLYAAQSKRAQRQSGLAAALRSRPVNVEEADRFYTGLGGANGSDASDGDNDFDDDEGSDMAAQDDGEAGDTNAEGEVAEGARVGERGIQRIFSGSIRLPALPRPPERSYELVIRLEPLSRSGLEASSSTDSDGGGSDSASVTSVESNEQDAERYAWQNMLSNVLEGDVLKSEKTRLASSLAHQLDDSSGQRKTRASQLWWGVRAYLRQRSTQAEQRFTQEGRARVPKLFEDLLNFRIAHKEDKTVWSKEANQQVQGFLGRLSWAQSLYPSLRALQLHQATFQEPGLQERIDALQAWSTITSRLHVHLGILQKWTGSEALEITKPGLEKIDEETDTPLDECKGNPVLEGAPHQRHTKPKILDTSNFVERMMKEESIESLFKKRTIADIFPLVRAAKETFLQNRKEFANLGLPPFSDDLSSLASFPAYLVKEALSMCIEMAQKVNKDDPSIVLIDQLTEDFRDGLKRATRIKKEYLEIIEADVDGIWQVPSMDLEPLNNVLMEALKLFFRLLHWKLKSGSKAIYLKETEVVESEWTFLSQAAAEIDGGDMLIAEHFSILTHRLILRVVNYFNESLEAFQNRKMGVAETSRWFNQTLDNVRQRHRKLLRFGKALAQLFQNATEYSLETAQSTINLSLFIGALCETDHFLVYNETTQQNGIYMIANSELQDRSDLVLRMLTKAFTQSSQADVAPEDEDQDVETKYDAPRYVLLISPRDPFLWTGRVMNLAVPESNLDVRTKRVRLVADGPNDRLAFARKQFLATFPNFAYMVANDSQAHLAKVNRDIKKIKLANFRLCESIIMSSDRVRELVKSMPDKEALLATFFTFAADIGLRSLRSFERKFRLRLDTELQKFAIKWVYFICEECNPSDNRTFKWVVAALEFVRTVTRGENIFKLNLEDFSALRSGVASCMMLLISHFDILGARTTQEAHREKEKLDAESQEMGKLITQQLEQLKSSSAGEAEDMLEEFVYFVLNSDTTSRRVKWQKAREELDGMRAEVAYSMGLTGRTLDQGRPEDPSLLDLASSKSNISIKWQQGKFIGSGTYGTVYLAVNLDSGGLMAVKEIRFQDSASAPQLINQIREEMSVMAMLHHPNIVEYFGIEVHRDKVYIFEEYCQNGSLASLLEHGRIEDEAVLQLYSYQLVDGLIYLHTKDIVHRDIKPDNILIDGQGNMKLADFGSAKVLAKKSKTLATRGKISVPFSPNTEFGPGVQNSLTGTPMYMSPEVIKGERPENQGAADVWSLGCVVLECATGKRPWAGLDNEWAIMFHIGVAKEHPPLPDTSLLSTEGIAFIEACLTIDAKSRPTAEDLLFQPWLENFAAEFYPDQGETESSTSTLDLCSPNSSHSDLLQQIDAQTSRGSDDTRLKDIGEEAEELDVSEA